MGQPNGVGLCGAFLLEPRVDRLAFEREDPEDAFVNAAEGLVANEAFEGFEAEGEFAQGEGAFGGEAA